MAPTGGFRVDTDVLRDYGTYCARQGDDLVEIAAALRRASQIPAIAWYGGHLTTLLQLQDALDGVRETYEAVRWSIASRVDRVGGELRDTGAALHATADDYDSTDQEIADWLGSWP